MGATKASKIGEFGGEVRNTAGATVPSGSARGRGDRWREAEVGSKEYEAELRKVHGELVAMQEWVKATGAKLKIILRVRRSHEQPAAAIALVPTPV